MSKINVLLLCGGGGAEHDISLASAKYFVSELCKLDFVKTYCIEIGKDGVRRDLHGRPCELRRSGELFFPDGNQNISLDFAIPCLHGFPGETGDVQSVFELMNLPYLGSGPEGSQICFNKVTTKLWLDSLQIPNAPFLFFYRQSSGIEKRALAFFKEHREDIFVKAAGQGSSVGVFHVNSASELETSIDRAFDFSPYVLLEKRIVGRELEVAVYQCDGQLQITPPGEIICPRGGFYDYHQKYGEEGQTRTLTKAPDLETKALEKIEYHSRMAFEGLGIRHLARIDFFLDEQGEPILNEINTFPGHTPISMFPMMLENNGHSYAHFLGQIIKKEVDRA